MRVGRVLLAGDCAHLVSPFGARGLNSGVWDAENAAWKVAYVLHGWGADELLSSYEQERLAAALENIYVTSAHHGLPGATGRRAAATPPRGAGGCHRRPGAPRQVDSGRLAEPFWYVQSTLTTAHPERTFPGRPPRGQTPPVVPGVIVPDVPIEGVDGGATRLRQIARDGFLVLTGDDVDPAAVGAALDKATTAPTRVLSLAEVDATGALRDALQPQAGEAWVIRPDAHLAAVVPAADTARLGEAVQRACGRAVTEPAV